MNSELQDTQPSMTVEEVRGSLDLTDNGAIKNSIHVFSYEHSFRRQFYISISDFSCKSNLILRKKEGESADGSNPIDTNALLATSFSSSCLEDRKYRLPHRIVPIPSDHVKPIK